jgi:hypothetical protein
MLESFRGILENPQFSPVGEDKKRKYLEATSGRDPLFFYHADDMEVEFYESEVSLEDRNHPFGSDRDYIVRYMTPDRSHVGFMEVTEIQMSFIDQKLMKDLDADGAYKKIVRDFA